MERNQAYVRHGQWWSAKDYARLLELRALGWTWAAIGKEINRSAESCSAKYAYERAIAARTHGPHIVQADIDVPRSVLEDRDRRRNLVPRTVTAAFFGDPLQGYSALDRMGQR